MEQTTQSQAGTVQRKRPAVSFLLLLGLSLLLGAVAMVIIWVTSVFSINVFTISIASDPINYLAILVFIFIFSLSLGINYTSKVFIFDLIISMIVVGVVPFIQCLFFVITFIYVQRLFKLI